MDARERYAVVHQFGRTYRTFLSAFESHVGQPLPRWRILFALYEQGAQSQRRLVDLLHVDAGALTRQIKLLESDGCIARATDERDNRVNNVSLTAAGREIVETLLPRRTAFLRQAMAQVPDDVLLALRQGLTLLERSMAEMAAPVLTPETPAASG
ncbi:MAG: MarR family winged helix-turn-helix transcriptional regulator [Janthinobacterium lividum]